MAIRAGWLFLPLAFVGCRTPTQITVEVTTDLPCAGTRGTTIWVGHVGADEDTPPVTVTAECNGGRVGALVVVPSGGKSDEVGIRIVTGVAIPGESCAPLAYKGCIVARRALHFVPHSELTLPIVMRGNCLDVPCTPTTTCVQSHCVPAAIVDSHVCTGGGCDESVLEGASDAGLEDTSSPLDTAASDGTTGDSALVDTAATETPVADTADADTASASCGSHPGSPMVYVGAATKPFCVDQRETTWGDYKTFVSATKPPHPSFCTWNTSYDGSAASDADPVTSVDWCDAWEYCNAAGKTLCGELSTGLPYVDTAHLTSTNQWSFACANGSPGSKYPYGGAYVETTCNGTLSSAVTAPGSHAACHGTTAPYDAVFDMSGNVYEWDAACDATIDAGTVAASTNCGLRGGSFGAVQADLACVTGNSSPMTFRSATIGFRCCLTP